MTPFKKIQSAALRVPHVNVDTDQIVPARYLKKPRSDDFGEYLFHDVPHLLDGGAEASVLVAGRNFACGSSREHAVWALKDYGFRVVLSSRFADIFRGNSGKQGLVTGIVSPEDIEILWKILETKPGTEVTVDLEAKTATAERNYDCTKAGNANKTACKGVATAAAAPAAAKPTQTASMSKASAATKPAAASTGAVSAANATAQCNDGAYSDSTNRSGTCSRHGGVAKWMDGK